MKLSLLLFLLVYIPAQQVVSQEVPLQELKKEQIALEEQIASLKKKMTTLEDSLLQVEKKIKVAVEKQKESIVDLAPNELIALKEVTLRSGPFEMGKEVLTLKKDTRILKIDKTGEYFLVCFQGTCGYVPTKDVRGPEKVQEEKDFTS